MSQRAPAQGALARVMAAQDKVAQGKVAQEIAVQEPAWRMATARLGAVHNGAHSAYRRRDGRWHPRLQPLQRRAQRLGLLRQMARRRAMRS